MRNVLNIMKLSEQMAFLDGRGYVIGGFDLVWITNVYRSLFRFIRLGMKREKMDADIEKLKLKIEKEKCK